jgi:hypothetical protein
VRRVRLLAAVALVVAAMAPADALAQSPGALDRDNDGVPDNIDACPDIAGDKTGERTTDGCPNHPHVVAKKADASSATDRNVGVVMAIAGGAGVAASGLIIAAGCGTNGASYGGCLLGLAGGGVIGGVGVISAVVGLVLIAANPSEPARAASPPAAAAAPRWAPDPSMAVPAPITPLTYGWLF